MPTITRIAVFYDGGYLQNVSFRYFNDPRYRQHIDFNGMHKFLSERISETLDLEPSLVQVTEAHWFRGLMPVDSAEDHQLRMDRTLEMIFQSANVTPHRTMLRQRRDSNGNTIGMTEKGVDVMMAMEAVAAAASGVEVIVMVSGDEDMSPVMQRVATYGPLTCLAYWNLPVDSDSPAGARPTFTSGKLVHSVSMPICISDELEDAQAGHLRDGDKHKDGPDIIDLLFPTRD